MCVIYPHVRKFASLTCLAAGKYHSTNAFLIPRTGGIVIQNIYTNPDQSPVPLDRSTFKNGICFFSFFSSSALYMCFRVPLHCEHSSAIAVIQLWLAQLRELVGIHTPKHSAVRAVLPQVRVPAVLLLSSLSRAPVLLLLLLLLQM